MAETGGLGKPFPNRLINECGLLISLPVRGCRGSKSDAIVLILSISSHINHE